VQSLRVVRDFPWRRTRDPWKILIAEFCCQQTQAARAAAAYERCCARFATPADCAAAPLRDVLEAWRGLGYYRRARDLQQAAIRIVEHHGGSVPDDLDQLLELSGVGAYTARAVLAFAFGRDVAIVDTNVARVLSRAVANRPLGRAEAQHLADSLVGEGRGWEHNQAMLDVGALHCTAVARCDGCPLLPSCRWRLEGEDAVDPAARTSGVSRRQPPYRGSDREGRGRLLAAVVDGPVRLEAIAVTAGWPDDPGRAGRVVDALVEEGLVARACGEIRVRER
jgi:A/G-specific adenine glycosylase